MTRHARWTEAQLRCPVPGCHNPHGAGTFIVEVHVSGEGSVEEAGPFPGTCRECGHTEAVPAERVQQALDDDHARQIAWGY